MAAELRWCGWGEPPAGPLLSPGALELLHSELGLSGEVSRPVELHEVELEPARLAQRARQALEDAVGAEWVQAGHEARVRHACGRSYSDLVRMRSGHPDGSPDAVVLPSTHEEMAAVLAVASRVRLAVVPFGGGTSVVGGVAPLRGEQESVIALDTRRLAALMSVDRRSLTARVQAGIRAPVLEAELAKHDLTLGHFPQSYEFVSLGGCAATRSAGQASTGYGRIDELILGLRHAAPAGELRLGAFPATAAGPDLRQLVIGSEGTLGVISELVLRLHPKPHQRRYEGLMFESFEAGAEALRAALQESAAPDIGRILDEEETRVTLAMAPAGGLKGRLGRSWIRVRGYSGGCLAIVGWEGEENAVARRRGHTLSVMTRDGGLRLGAGVGASWEASRFAGPYLRDELLDRGVMVETVETATDWTRLLDLRAAVSAALRQALVATAGAPIVLCHISHAYSSGASLYFTVIAQARRGRELEQWQAAKRAAGDAIVAGGGTISHHHAVGRDHAPWLERELGSTGIGALRALKGELDPAGIMNPGKLLPAG